KNQSGFFLAWIGLVTNLGFEIAARRFRGLLNATAMNVVNPAVIQTTNAAIFNSPQSQIGPAMRAVQTEQTQPAVVIAKENQFLPHDFNSDRRIVLQLLGKRDRLPVSPDELPAGRAGIGLSQELVFLVRQHRCLLFIVSVLG